MYICIEADRVLFVLQIGLEHLAQRCRAHRCLLEGDLGLAAEEEDAIEETVRMFRLFGLLLPHHLGQARQPPVVQNLRVQLILMSAVISIWSAVFRFRMVCFCSIFLPPVGRLG